MKNFFQRFFSRCKPYFRWLWRWIITYRRLLRALPLSKIPVSSKFFGRPKGFYLTALDYVNSPSGKAGGNRSQEIYPAETIHFKLPTSLDGGEPHWKFRENQIKEMPPSYVFELKEARFWGHYGGSIISADDKLISDLSPDVLGLKNHTIFSKIKLPKCQRLNGVVAVLSTAEAATNYWHWTFDLLPRIHLLEKAGFTPETVDFYLVNHSGSPYQMETLAELGIHPDQIIRTDKRTHFEIERMVISSLKPSQFHVTKWACDFLRALAPAPSTGDTRGRRLFISRENAGFRKLKNELETFEALQSYGFEKILCEKLSVRQQREIFSQAEFIVAPHGSGLTNLAYCRAGTKVAEIFSPSYVDIAFWTHASQSGLNHGYVFGKGDIPPEGIDPVERTIDYEADIEKLVAAIHRMSPVVDGHCRR